MTNELLKRCLHWDPSVRLTPTPALRHSWISKSVPRPLTTEKVSGKQVVNPAKAFQGLGSKLPQAVGTANTLKANLMLGIPLFSVLPKLIS